LNFCDYHVVTLFEPDHHVTLSCSFSPEVVVYRVNTVPLVFFQLIMLVASFGLNANRHMRLPITFLGTYRSFERGRCVPEVNHALTLFGRQLVDTVMMNFRTQGFVSTLNLTAWC
jgi:hypothetical protein